MGGNYQPGKLTYTVADTTGGAVVLVFVVVLLRTYAGRKIRLVCDNGRFHTTKAGQQFWTAHQAQLEI